MLFPISYLILFPICHFFRKMKFLIFALSLLSVDRQTVDGFRLTPDAAGDKITSLPGLDKMPPFSMFSGYLDVTKTKKLHYWFVESQRHSFL